MGRGLWQDNVNYYSSTVLKVLSSSANLRAKISHTQLLTYRTMDRLMVTERNGITLIFSGSGTQELGSTQVPPPLFLPPQVSEVPVLTCSPPR